MAEGIKKKGFAHGRAHWVAFAAVYAAAWALFIHPDVLETSNHAYILLESLFQGKFLDFFNVVAQRPTALYYENHAHYNIVVYLLYAVAELPYYIGVKLTGAAPNGDILQYLGKLVVLGFHCGNLVLVQRLTLQLGLAGEKAGLAALAYGLSVPAFFSVAIMGQYDVVSLFFILLSLLMLMRGRMWAFVLWAGLGITFKFFGVFVFIPLLLLYEKRLRRLLLYGLAGLWLILPTTLLFAGRTGEQTAFLDHMASRLFGTQLPAAYSLPAFAFCYFLLCVLCWLWRPEAIDRRALWVCLATFSLFFFFVTWNPQWVALLCPFIVLTGAMEKNAGFWLCADLGFSLGFLGLAILTAPPTHFGDNLLDLGFWGYFSGVSTRRPEGAHTLGGLLNRVPALLVLCAVLFFGALAVGMVLKFPLKRGSLGGRLFPAAPAGEAAPAKVWAVFALCIGGWFLLVMLLWFLRAAAL